MNSTIPVFKLFTLSLLMLLIPRQSWAEEPFEELFKEANRYYNEALSERDTDSRTLLFEKALLRYRQLTEQGGIINSLLFCNIGNAYAQLGDNGRAVLYFKRGLYYRPNDYRCKNNLAYLRDRIQSETLNLLLPISPRMPVTLFTAAFSLFCVILALFLQRRHAEKAYSLFSVFTNSQNGKHLPAAVLKYSLLITGIAVIIFLSLIVVSRSIPPQAVILEETAPRTGDSILFSPIEKGPLPPGTEIRVKSERSGWYLIELSAGVEGWIPSNSAELVPVNH